MQDCEGAVHQLGCDALGLPWPTYYRIPQQVGAHSFTSSKVLPIDSGGNPVNGSNSLYSFLHNPIPAGGMTLPASTVYGFNGAFPGAMIKAKYGQPVCIRFVNELDKNPYNLSRNDFGMEEYLTHLHNGHTASESDGNPNWLQRGHYEPGQWCDNLYLNWPAAGEDWER